MAMAARRQIEPAPISTEARIAVRNLKAQIVKSSAAVHKLVHDRVFDDYLNSFMFKNGKGQERAYHRLIRLVPARLALMRMRPRLICWVQLCCTEHLVSKPKHPGEAQDAICTEFILAHFPVDNSHYEMRSGVWTMEIPDHALGRMFQRNPKIDGRAALFAAHNALLRTELYIPPPEKDESVYVPTPDGVFAGNMMLGDFSTAAQPYQIIWYFRARTYLHEDQLQRGQVPRREGKPSYAETIMQPQPLIAGHYEDYFRSKE